MTKRPHDALFKAAFEYPPHAAELLRGCVSPSLASAVTWESLALEDGSFVDRDLADSHTDLLFSAEIGGTRGLIYVLLEHQSRRDSAMPLRMNEYIARIWSRTLRGSPSPRVPIVIPIVLSHAQGGWNAPVEIWDLVDPHPDSLPAVAPHVPRLSIIVHEFSEWSDEEIRRRVLASFPRLALWVLRDARRPERLLTHLRSWAAAFVDAARARNGITALAQLVHYVQLVLGREHYQEFRAKLKELAPDVERQVMTILDMLEQESRAAGRAEGFLEAQRQVLLKQLRAKFGGLAESDVAKVERADVETLDRYLDRILTADSLAAVLGG